MRVHMRPSSPARLFLAAIIGTVLAACSDPVPPPEVMFIRNRLGRPITEIQHRPCGGGEEAFVSVPIEGGIPPGGLYQLPLMAGCVDLRAVDQEGRVVGEQHDLRMMAGARWRISR